MENNDEFLKKIKIYDSNNSYNNALNIFGLKPGYTEDELRKVYHPIAFRFHSDRTDNDDTILAIVNSAYELLKNKVRNEKLENEEKEKNIFVATWKNDIRALQSKYGSYKEVINLCKNYLNRIEKIKTLEELKKQKEEFNQEIKVIKEKIYYQTEKDSFKKNLLFTIKFAKDDDVSKLAIYYLELTDNVYTLQELRKLEEEYEQKAIQLKEEKRLKEWKEAKRNFQIELKEISEKYQDEKTRELVNYYSQELDRTKEKKEIVALQKKFQEELKTILKEKLELLERKTKLKNYFQRFKEEIYQEVVEKYLALIDEVKSNQELCAIRNNFDEEIKKIKAKKRLEEKKAEKQIATLKEITKRSLISYFYKASLNLPIDKIMLEANVLRETLKLLENTNSSDLNMTLEFLSTFRFQNFQEETGKLKLFQLLQEKKFQNEAGIKDFLKSFKEDSLMQEEVMESSERNRLKNKIMNSFYYYAFPISLKDINIIFKNLDKVLNFLQTLDDDTLYRNISKLDQISFKNMPLTEEIIDSLKPSNRIFISRKNGMVCTLDKLGTEILIRPLDLSKPLKTISERTAKADYISLAEFFKKATYVGNHEVLERINSYQTANLLYFFDRNFVYFYQNLLLVYNKPIGDKEPYFEFDALTNRNHDYVLSDKHMSPFNDSREFADRTYCEKMVMEQFAKQLQMENEYDENISKK